MGGGNVSQDQTSIICIDLKSFYASVECVERGLNPFKTNLVVADPTRSKSTICLAITPAMKSLGIKNRCRIHEIPDCVKYITAMPRMQLYMDYSAKIYGIYLRYVSKEDIHVYSVDECFIDVTNYLQLYHLTAKEMAVKLMQEVMEETGITATAGVGTNLYLAKIAMDIVAKHVDDHIGILDEFSYREQLWDHKPLSDFWRIGSRTEKKLAGYGIHTMGDIAMASLRSERLLYSALIGYIWYEAPEEEQNFSTLLEFINASETREDDEEFKNAVDELFEELEAENPEHFAVRQYRKYKLAAGKTAKSILISCGARLAPFDIQELREIMSYDEMELDMIGDQRTAMFVIISDTDDTFNFKGF